MFKMCGHGDKSRKLAFLTRAQGLPLCPNLSIIIATPRDVNQNTALIRYKTFFCMTYKVTFL